MAIFIASTKSISRGKGQSAVACAAYRAGENLVDDRYGKIHKYAKRSGVVSADIILPSILKNKNVIVTRSDIWNMAEAAENRKDARVAREWLVALPYELSEKQRQKLAREFAQMLSDRYGVIVDYAIHKPTEREVARGASEKNFHVHFLLTTRKIELSENNEIIFSEKSLAELSDKKRQSMGLERMSEEIKTVRKMWEEVANDYLSENKKSLIDCRSYAERELDIVPQIKMGVNAVHLERRTGIKSEIGRKNAVINERNRIVLGRYAKQKSEFIEKLNFIEKHPPVSRTRQTELSVKMRGLKNYVNDFFNTNHENFRQVMNLPNVETLYTRSLKQAQAERQRQAKAQAQAERQRQAKAQAQAERQRQAKAQAQAEQRQRQAKAQAQAPEDSKPKPKLIPLEQRRPSDLLRLRVNVQVARRGDISGLTTFGSNNILHAINARNAGHGVAIEPPADNNYHVSHSTTASSIRRLMFANPYNFQLNTDYNELTIIEFTDKYGLNCDLSDLTTLYDTHPLAEPVEVAQIDIQTHTDHNQTITNDDNVVDVPKNDDNDFGLSF